MLVKIINKYYDTQLKRLVNPNEELTVDEARASVLVNAKVATPTTPEMATKPKKTRSKKVEGASA